MIKFNKDKVVFSSEDHYRRKNIRKELVNEIRIFPAKRLDGKNEARRLYISNLYIIVAGVHLASYPSYERINKISWHNYEKY